jgi:2-dehydro-3-deoxy-D-arabinonate dehydratase
MRLYKTTKGFVIEDEGYFYLSKHSDWDTFVNRQGLYFEIKCELQKLTPDYDYKAYIVSGSLPPIGTQEVWASGVTYLRSKNARMEESKEAGGGNFYDRVYDAPRPELFFKSASHRVRGNKEEIRIRRDSKWNVPEPELTLFINSFGQLAGYTVGNDVSSRDIEGENPLYLPQAKTYDGSAAIGPCLYITDEPLPLDTEIRLDIFRDGKQVFHECITIDQIKRSFDELISYLLKELSFPTGCYLMTGTGIIPKDEFSLVMNDEVRITISEIGTLINTVSMKKAIT